MHVVDEDSRAAGGLALGLESEPGGVELLGWGWG